MNNIRLERMSSSARHERVLQEVLDDAPGYALAITGAPPPPDAARALSGELPPGRLASDKFVFGVYLGDRLVGCADVVRGYPAHDLAFIGLLVIREPHQGAGLGLAAYQALELVMCAWGCTRARLAVVEANARALSFWARAGFHDTGERRDYEAGAVRSRLVLMEKRL